MSDTSPDTERSVVVHDHPFETEEGQEHMPCMMCGLASYAHVHHKTIYISTSKRAKEGSLPGVSEVPPVTDIRGSAGEPMGFSEKELVDAQKKKVAKKVKELEREVILHQQGHKDDTGKTQYFAMPWLALDEMAEVMTFGAVKYDLFNFRKGMKWSRLWSAALRHLVAWWRGEDNDQETGKSHLAHVLCCVAMLLEIQKLKRGEDDRCK